MNVFETIDNLIGTAYELQSALHDILGPFKAGFLSPGNVVIGGTVDIIEAPDATVKIPSASCVLQGQYMGVTRRLYPEDKATAKRIRTEQGVEAAIDWARNRIVDMNGF